MSISSTPVAGMQSQRQTGERVSCPYTGKPFLKGTKQLFIIDKNGHRCSSHLPLQARSRSFRHPQGPFGRRLRHRGPQPCQGSHPYRTRVERAGVLCTETCADPSVTPRGQAHPRSLSAVHRTSPRRQEHRG